MVFSLFFITLQKRANAYTKHVDRHTYLYERIHMHAHLHIGAHLKDKASSGSLSIRTLQYEIGNIEKYKHHVILMTWTWAISKSHHNEANYLCYARFIVYGSFPSLDL